MRTINHNKTATVTESRIKSPKGFHFVCSLLALLSDIAVLAVLLMNVTEFKFWLCPLIIAVLDAVFLFKIIFSNYRFSYAFKGVLLHIALLIAVSAFAALSTGFLEERIVFEQIAFYAMPAVHLIQCIAVLFTALHASHKNVIFHRIAAIALTATLAAGVGFYGSYLITKGFFGQGFSQENRTLYYSLDQEKNQYVVRGVLDGKGNKVVIPAQFNGLPVGGIDCALFADTEILTVQLDCEADVRFENIAAFSNVREDMQILSSKEDIDTFRQTLYGLTETNPNMLNLANSILPDDLDNGEIYVTFRYSMETLQNAKYEIIPTWFASKGAVFDVKKHADNISYVSHSDSFDNADLYFCYQNQNGLILSKVESLDGTVIDGAALDASTEAMIEFDKIYRLQIEEDNDEKYTVGDEYRFLNTADGQFAYKLATADNAQRILDAFPKREGFTFKWNVGQDKHSLESVKGEFLALDRREQDCLVLYPVWNLKEPEITVLTVDGVTNDHRALYGSDVVLHSEANAPASDISLRYEWRKEDAVSSASTYTLKNLHPEDAGEYILTVTAYSDTVTSLTASVSQKIRVGFEKRELNILWNLPTDTVYSAYEKKISASADVTDVINNDKIDFLLSREGVKDVGEYQVKISLTGDADKKYFIPETDLEQQVIITPYRLNVNWGESSFVYEGVPKAPPASAKGLGEDGMLEITVKGEQQNVGSYTATAETSNKNYELAGNTLTYHITPRPIEITSWKTDSLVYSGTAQSVTVAEVSNAVKGEESKVISEMTYLGTGVNVGSYTTSASLPETSNYMLSGNVSTAFQITPKNLTVTILDQSTVYSGAPYIDFSFIEQGLVETDKIEEVLSLNYKGEAVTAINASVAQYVIDADVIGNTKYDNYTVTLVPGKLQIDKKNLDIYLTDASKVYDGTTYPYDDFTFTHEGLVSADAIEDVCSITFNGAAVNAVSVATKAYTLDAETLAQEKYDNYNIIIHPATLTISKAPLNVTAVGGNKIYDGTVGSDFSVLVDGMVAGETADLLGSPIYGGAAISNKNVGTHTLTVRFNENTTTRNYDITYLTGTFEITQKDLTVTAVGGSKEYNGLVGGSFDFMVSGLVATDTKNQLGTPSYGGTAATAKNANSYTLTVKLPKNTTTDNYRITYIDGDFEITPKPITVSVTSSDKMYDGTVGGSFNFSVSGLAVTDSKSVLGQPTYGGEATSAINVGSYSLTVSLPGNDNYQILSYTDGVFRIMPKKVVVTPLAETRDYNGTVGGTFDFSVTGLVGNDTKALFGTPTYSGTALTAKNAGNYTLSVTLSAEGASQNYEVVYTQGSFEIRKKGLTVIAIGGSKVYDGTVGSGFGFEVNGLVGGDTKEMLGTPSYGGDAIGNKSAGEHTLTVTLPNNAVTANYNINYVDSVYSISKKSLNVIATAPGGKVYDGAVGSGFGFDVTGLADGDTKEMLGNPTFGGEAVSNKNVGTHALTVTLPNNTVTSNYSITYEGTVYTISKKDLTVSAVGGSKVYDGTVGSGFDFNVTGLANGDTKEMLGAPTYGGDAGSNKNVGSYSLTVTLPTNTVTSNYNITYANATYSISKKDLQIIAVATDRAYDGSTGGNFTFEMNGLVEGDTAESFGTPTFAGTAITATEAGTYTLTVSFPESQFSSNYEITYVPDESFVISE